MPKREASGSAAKDAPKKEPKKLTITDANETPAAPTSKRIEIKEHSEPEDAVVDGDAADDVAAKEPVPEAADAAKTTQEPGTEPEPTIEESLATDEPTDLPEITTIGEAIDASVQEPVKTMPEEPADTEEAAEPDDAISDTEEPTETEEVVSVEATEEPTEKEDFSDDKTANAVDDIVATETDELLQRQDDEKVQQEVVAEKKKFSLKEFLANWWKNPATKWGTLVGLLLVIILTAMLPAARYYILNAAGVRVKASVVVVSNETQQPLKNVDVTVADQSIKTDENGKASFTKLRLGKTNVKIVKRGYATVEQSKVLGWGSNPLKQIGLTVTGSQFGFVIRDFLSDKAVLGAEAFSGEFNATADKDGKINLAIDQDNDDDIEVTIKASDYRDEKVIIKSNNQTEKIIKLVPAKKHIFVSKRSGKFDVYKIDADAKNEAILLAATGSEREDMIVVPHPITNFVAVVSTRDGKRNKDGYLLSGLFVVDVNTGALTKVTQSERIQIIDWTGDRIVYIAVTDGASAASPSRSKLLSFEIGQPGPKELATANYFNDAIIFKGSVYYAPSSYAIPVANVKFYRVNPDGSGLSSLFDKEVWNIFRNDYDTLYLSVQQDWYELKAGGTPAKLANAPANLKSRPYKENPDKKQALWVDTRDGKGVLLAYSAEAKKDEVIETRPGLTLPVYWLNNTTLVFRVSDGREVADYVKNIEGGVAVKLRDVTNTDMAYYFN